MSGFDNPMFTRRLTSADSPFTISKDSGIAKWSMLLVSGAATLKGTRKIGNLESTPIDLVEGSPINASSSDGVCCFVLEIAGGAFVDFLAASD